MIAGPEFLDLQKLDVLRTESKAADSDGWLEDVHLQPFQVMFFFHLFSEPTNCPSVSIQHHWLTEDLPNFWSPIHHILQFFLPQMGVLWDLPSFGETRSDLSLSQMGHDLRTLIPSFCYRESSRIIWAGCVHGDLLLGATLAAYANAVCCGQRDRHSVLTGSDVSFWMWMMMWMMMMMNVIIVIMYLLFLLRESWFLFER